MSNSAKLKKEIAEITFVLEDMKKTKNKCLELSQSLGIDLKNKDAYSRLQRQISLKLNLLDQPGLIQLKNKLMIALDQLFDTECDLKKRKTIRECRVRNPKKGHAHRLLMDIQLVSLTSMSIISEFASQSQIDNQSTAEDEISCQQKAQILQAERTMLQQKKRLKEQAKIKSIQLMNKISQSTQIPIYTIREQNCQNKLDSIMKCVASLRRNMKMQAYQYQLNSHQEQVNPLQQSQRIKTILKQDPQYNKLKEAYQRLRMREQQLGHIIQREVLKRMTQILNTQAEVIETTAEYKIVKIKNLYAADRSQKKEPKPSNTVLREVTNEKHNQRIAREETRTEESQLKLLPLESINQQCGSNEDSDLKSDFETLSHQVQNTEQKIKELRDKRKRIFEEEDDIWDEIESL